jgi:multidrug resistance efflux pump
MRDFRRPSISDFFNGIDVERTLPVPMVEREGSAHLAASVASRAWSGWHHALRQPVSTRAVTLMPENSGRFGSTSSSSRRKRAEISPRVSLRERSASVRENPTTPLTDQLLISTSHRLSNRSPNTVAALNGDPSIEIDHHPTVRAAKAQLDRARLDLSYATVMAPDDGVVTRVDDLQVGDFVNPGAAVFSLLSSRRVWIEANFRETGLTHMRPGQEATIDVDAYPDREFKAHVVIPKVATQTPDCGNSATKRARNTTVFSGVASTISP